MIKIIYKFIIAIAFTFYSLNSISESDEHHQHDAHVHGTAVLNIVVEEQTILIELETPAMNVLGFEHAPKTEKQHATVNHANERFKNYLSLLSIPNRQCKQTGSNLELAHDKHENEHNNKNDDTHSEYHLSYTINCDSIENLKLEISLFENFRGFEHIDLNWINGNEQGKFELTAEHNLIEL